MNKALRLAQPGQAEHVLVAAKEILERKIQPAMQSTRRIGGVKQTCQLHNRDVVQHHLLG
jgi:hypothetical protein